MIKTNDFNGQQEFHTTAKVVSISPTIRYNSNVTEKHPKGTPWQIARAEVTYPNGTKEVVGTSIFTTSLDMHAAEFEVGKTVEMVVQMEGEGAGYSKLQLPQLAKFNLGLIPTTEKAEEVTTGA